MAGEAFFFPFQTFLCPHLHSSDDPLPVQHHSLLLWKCGMKIAVFSVLGQWGLQGMVLQGSVLLLHCILDGN